ncbi:unnamed protein product [Somion occarium]|uniref:NudC domain-containing protein 1 n=1 Tax=Somion occarium TaxID=3059160 RepID=A0ABP1DZ42_9APHY
MFEPDRSLLNPKFNSYVLHSLDQDKAISRYPLSNKLSQTNISGRSPLSFQEVQSRIRHNHLTVGPNGRAATLVPSFHTLYELPRPIQASTVDSPHREYPSAAFINVDNLLVSDGYGSIYAIHVPQSGPARVINSYELSIPEVYESAQSSVPFRLHRVGQTSEGTCLAILSSRHYSNSSSTSSKGKVSNAKFDVWGVSIDLEAMSQDQSLQLDIVWHRRGNDVPIFVAYDDPRKAFMLLGSNPYRAIDVAAPATYEPAPDEIAPIPRAGESLDARPSEDILSLTRPPPYSWTQTSDSVTVAFPLPSDTPKNAIRVTFSPRTLTVLVQKEDTDDALSIPLPHYTAKVLWDGIQPSASFWTWDRQAEHSFGLLTLHLDKQHEGTRWAQVFALSGTRPAGDTSEDDVEVPETLDPSELYLIRESLEKYTAALQKGEDASGLGLGRGVPSLGEGEMDPEIDSADANTVCVTWVGVDGSVPSWERSLDAPFTLLSTPFPSSPAPQPTLIVKNGVDGVLFTLSEASSPSDPPEWKHTSTFSALSFVLASKRDTRFVHHVSDQAVLAFESGTRGNVYIYRNTAGIHDPVAKQAVLKIGGGAGGSLLGVGMMHTKVGKPIILCLCEGEWIVAHDVL